MKKISTEFQWQTDEDEGWDAPKLPAGQQPGSGRPSFRRRITVLTLILVLATTAAVVVYRRVAEQVDQTTAETAGNIVGAFQIVERAAESADSELLTSVLSGRDAAWTGAMETLAAEGLLFDRPLFGFTNAQPPELEPSDVRLADDLQAAELLVPLRFVVGTATGIGARVTMTQTQLYRRSSDGRWLLAPPIDDFWGEPGAFTGQRLTGTFLSRDAVLLDRLFQDLDTILQEACALPGVLCGESTRLDVRFSTDPETLARNNYLRQWRLGTSPLVLPTPTLVGVPGDEAGYAALLHGYGVLLARRFLAETAGYTCCELELFLQAVQDLQLDRLGLQAWPLDRTDYARLAADADMVENPYETWSGEYFDFLREKQAWIAAYATVAYLLQQQPELTASELRALAFERRADLGPTGDDDAWLAFIGEQTQPEAGERTASDTGLVETICNAPTDSGDAPGPVLRHRHYLGNGSTASWQLPLRPGIGYPLPPGEAFLFIDFGQDGAVYFANPLADPLPITQPGLGSFLFAELLPALDRATLFFAEESSETLLFGSLDLGACAAGRCQVQPLPAHPLWSPDGQWALTVNRAVFGPAEQFLLLDAGGSIVRDLGAEPYLPFMPVAGAWLDNTRFVYAIENTVYSGSVAEEAAAVLVDIPAGTNGEESRYGRVKALAATSELIYGAQQLALPERGYGTILFRYDLQRGTYEELDREEREILFLDISPGEQYVLAFYGPGGLSGNFRTKLFTSDGALWGTWEASEIVPFGQHYWSPDGRWVLVPGDRMTRLVNVETSEYRLLPFGIQDGCYINAWSE